MKIGRSKANSMIYPVLTLPIEITSEIFIHCLPSELGITYLRYVDPEDDEFYDPSDEARFIEIGPLKIEPPQPILLSWVCRSWRAICLSTPALWASLHLHFPDDLAGGFADAFNQAKVLIIARSWFARAGTLPISLGLFSPGPLNDFYPISIARLWIYHDKMGWDSMPLIRALLLEHAQRLQQVVLVLHCEDFTHLENRYWDLEEWADMDREWGWEPENPSSYLDRLGLPSFPLLRKLILDDCAPDAESGFDCSSHFFHDAPQLRDVSFKDMFLQPRPCFVLPWSQLTVFSGYKFYPSQCLRALRDCPQLKQCTFTTVVGGDLSLAVSHRTLEDLALTPVNSALLHRLQLSRLHRLSLTGTVVDESLLLQFLSLVADSLHTFAYSDCDPHDPYNMSRYSTLRADRVIPALGEWFGTMSGLTTIALRFSSGSLTLLGRLKFILALNRAADATFLAHLRTLEIHHTDYNDLLLVDPTYRMPHLFLGRVGASVPRRSRFTASDSSLAPSGRSA